jgi:hypothetical protein
MADCVSTAATDCFHDRWGPRSSRIDCKSRKAYKDLPQGLRYAPGIGCALCRDAIQRRFDLLGMMTKPRTRTAFYQVLVGGTLALAALATSAGAQKAQVLLNTLKELGAALQACWAPPPMNQSRPGMQITVMMSFKRNGELFGQPKVTFESPGASDDERLAYRIAVAQMLKRCTPLPFTDALGNAVAGRPFTIRFTDDRKLKRAEKLGRPRISSPST